MKINRILFLIALCYASATQGQTVDFTWSATSGTFCAPQKVTFTQNCTPAPGGFIWNFGNGQSNVHATDTALYLAPGTYTVKLIALYLDTAIAKTKTITINPVPTIVLSSNVESICQPGDISFIATASPSLASCVWDFDDGSPLQTTSVNTVTHHFNNFGDYDVIVTGYTEFGCFSKDTISVSVRQFTITGDISPTQGCIPLNVFLSVQTNVPAGDAVQSYVWNYGDGSPLFTNTQSNVIHSYNITTTVIPHVTVTTTNGCVSEYDFQASAYGIPPLNLHAQTLSGLDTFCGSKTIEFIAHAQGADAYLWNYGELVTATVPDTLTTFHYSDTGNYHLVITPLFHGCPGDKDSFDIYIKGVIAKFDVGNTCTNRNTFTFTNTSSGHISHYEWSYTTMPGFLDSVHVMPTVTFPPEGIFDVHLTLIDSISGCTDTTERRLFTALPQFSSNKPSVCKDSVIEYHVTNTYAAQSHFNYVFHVDGDIVDNFIDSNLVRTALNHGIYNDYVVIDHNNPNICKDTLYLSHPTKVTGPVVDFTYTPDHICLKTPVTIVNNSHPFFPSDAIVTWNWDFFDGGGSGMQNPPPYLYQTAGQYIISLTATDNAGCSGIMQRVVKIEPIPEITVYPRRDTICMSRDTSILSAYTIDPFVWIPATDISCNNCDTIKAWPSHTTYYVAEATNIGGCKNTDTSFIRVFGPIDMHILPDAEVSVCPKESITINIDPPGVTTWSPVTYLSSSTSQSPIITPDVSTDYQVIVTDSAKCYADTTLVKVHVYDPPLVNAGPDRLLPQGSPFTLNPQYGAGVQTYTWTPAGNLSCNNCASPSGTAEQTITYTIAVTDNKGCKAKDDVKIILTCDKAGLFMPGAFTPFNGGVNNYFYPLTRGYKSIKSFIIYNRLGNKVFERKDFSPNISTLGWNGTVNGDRTHGNEAFVWFVEAVCEQGETVSAKGTVLLIR